MEQHNHSESNQFLDALDARDYRILAVDLHLVPLTKGLTIYTRGKRFDYVYFPTRGLISIVVLMSDGRMIETGIVGREGICSAGMIGTDQAFDHAVVQIAGAALRVPCEKFLTLYDASKGFRDAVNRYNMKMWSMAQQSAGCNAVHDVASRLAKWLLQARDLTSSDELPLTQELLSIMLGVRRTTVTLVAGQLHDQGLIAINRALVRILDAEGLSKCACECYQRFREHRSIQGTSAELRRELMNAQP